MAQIFNSVRVQKLQDRIDTLGILSIHQGAGVSGLDEMESLIDRVTQTKASLTREVRDRARSSKPNEGIQF